MKQSLELKLGQRLTMTPQLQQAIRLLQLSAVELQAEIQKALDSNPLLEEGDDEGVAGKPDTDAAVADERSEPGADSEREPAELELNGADSGEEMALDSNWEDNLDFPSASRSGGEDLPEIDSHNSQPLTLRDHLYWQMRLTPFTEHDLHIAQVIIDSINADGYLSCTLEDIRQALPAEPETEIDEIEAVLHQIQNFEPVGVAARDLSECLTLQLRAFAPDTPGLAHARELVSRHLALLGNRDYAQLRRLMKLRADELQVAIHLIQNLNPRPGGSIEPAHTTYVVPDIIVRRFRNLWRAELNPAAFPRLRIHRRYEGFIRRGDSSRDNKYLQDQLQEARWFIKSLRNRNETLLKVARTIVERQQDFFNLGEEAMKPLVLHDIAETLGLHESTISRVTTHKYMMTPRGILELKYFFSSHVGTADGGTCSATAIRSLIRKLVESESPTKPISDSHIVKMLEERGINVARRTVAKYREFLNIPPSNQRKSLM